MRVRKLCYLERRLRSARTKAQQASTMTGVRRAKQTSWRPLIEKTSIFSVTKLKLRWDLAMLDVGLKATLKISWLPFVMPPFIPPQLFVEVWPALSVNLSLHWLPFILADVKPAPNSMPRTPGMLKTRCEISDSTESKKGSPSPASTWERQLSTRFGIATSSSA